MGRSVGRLIPQLVVQRPNGRLAASSVVTVLSLLAAVLAATSQTAAAASTLLSQACGCTASSSVENASFPASNAVDGSEPGTRWSSAFADPAVAAGGPGRERVGHAGDAAVGGGLRQRVPDPGLGRRVGLDIDLLHHRPGTGDTQTLTVTGEVGRYVRMYPQARCGRPHAGRRYSLWEFQVYGSLSRRRRVRLRERRHRSAGCRVVGGERGHMPAVGCVRRQPRHAVVESAFADPQWLRVDLGVQPRACARWC